MSEAPQGGTEGPYPAPLDCGGGSVLPEWIDYNGHMNVAYYVLAFDKALDRMLEDWLGIGESFVAAARQGPYVLQSSVHYLDELLEGDPFTVEGLLIDCDAKRMHVMLRMLKADGAVAATSEQLLVNVDLEARRSTPYPDWAQGRLSRMKAEHADAPRPPQCGQPLGIRRR